MLYQYHRTQFTILLPTACDKKTYCGPPITFLHTTNSIYPVFSDWQRNTNSMGLKPRLFIRLATDNINHIGHMTASYCGDRPDQCYLRWWGEVTFYSCLKASIALIRHIKPSKQFPFLSDPQRQIWSILAIEKKEINTNGYPWIPTGMAALCSSCVSFWLRCCHLNWAQPF